MYFYRYLLRKGILPFSSLPFSLIYYLRYYWFKLPLGDLHHLIFNRLLLGRSLLHTHIEDFVVQEIPEQFYAPAIDHLKRAQQCGHLTLILSSSPDFLVSEVARFLKVDAWGASSYAIDPNGAFSEIISVMDGTRKAAYVREFVKDRAIAREDTFAYSDSFHDLPLLLEAGTAIAVNPDKKLAAYAREHNWQIL